MTDKQIIIDGEQCEYLRDTGLCRLTYCFTEKSYDCSMCKDNPNCHYKNWQRKEQECETLASQLDFEVQKKECLEQECERLKQGYAELTEIVSPYMDDFTGYNEELGGFDIVLCVKELMEQLDQLKAENEELKHQIEDVDILVNEKESLIDKCLQTLTEIKEIAEDKSYIGFWDEQISKILQICGEVKE